MDFPDFPKFEEFLYKLSERKLGGKNDAELMCPATFTKDTTRANRNVLDWAGWAAGLLRLNGEGKGRFLGSIPMNNDATLQTWT